MPEMPTLGQPPKKSPLPKVALAAVLIGAVAGGIFWLTRPHAPQGAAEPAPAPPAAKPLAAETPPPPAHPLDARGWKRATVRIDGPLETALVAATGKEVGEPLTQVVTRSLVWWVEVPNEILRGDVLDVLYQERANEEPLVHAVRFQSGKHQKTYQAYRFAPSGATVARLYSPTGEELEQRLDPSPLDDYEQVTSLLRDGRRHKGVDFKTPIGTPIRATFDGTITRKNWNFRGNGNCLEITERGTGRKALYLHLSEVPSHIRTGMSVKKGQVLGATGNTGRSFAPHLHYQLMAGTRVLDPFRIHRTHRRSIDPAHRAALDAEIRTIEPLWADTVAAP